MNEFIRSSGIRLAGITIAALITAALLGAFYWNANRDATVSAKPSQAPTRACSTVNQVYICGDTFVLSGGSPDQYRGNITLQKVSDDKPFLFVEGVILDNGSETNGDAFGLQQVNTQGVALMGSFRMVSDTLPFALHTDHFEWLCVDTVEAIVSNDNSCFRDGLGNLPSPNIPERNESLALNFIDRMGMRNWYQRQFSQTNISKINFNFDLGKREANALVPIRLDLRDNDENPTLEITARLKFSETGQLKSGTIDGFEFVWGSLNLEASGIKVVQGQFTMNTVKVSAVKNPEMAFLRNVDGIDSDEIFSLSNVRYVSNTFRIDGVNIPIRDFKFGNTGDTGGFRMTNQKLGITVDPTIKKGVFLISSTLQIPKLGGTPADFRLVEASLRLSAGIVTGTGSITQAFKPSAIAVIQDFPLETKIADFVLEGVQFVFSASENFYGIRANQAKVRWSQKLGGQTGAGVGALKFGFKSNGDLVWEVGTGTLGTPQIKNGVFQGTSILGTTSPVVSNTVIITFTGSLVLKIPGGAKNDANASINPVVTMLVRIGKNVKTDCAPNTPISTCAKHFEARLSGFGFSLASFKIKVVDPKFRDDGGFEVATATLGLPTLIGSAMTTTVQSLVIDGAGKPTVGGGQIEVPPLSFAGHQFVGFKGGFLPENRIVNGETVVFHKFTGGASLSIPGLDPTSGKKFEVDVTVVTKPPSGDLDEFDVDVSYQTRPGIPLASTGFEIVRFSGGFNLKPQSQIIISIGVGTETTVRFPVPVVGTIPLAAIDGQAEFTINTAANPDTYRLELGAQLKLLVFQIAQATIEMGDGAGFRVCPDGSTGSSCPRAKGFHANLTIEALFIHGSGDVRIGKINGNTRIAGSASLIYGLEKGQFGTAKPPFDITLGVSAQCCEFNIPGTTNARGLLATLHIPGPWDPTAFVDFQKSIGQSGFVKLVDPDDYALISSDEVEDSLKKGLPGYRRDVRSFRSFAADGITAVDVTQRTDIVPISVPTGVDTVLFGIHFSNTVTPGDPLSPTIKLAMTRPPGRGGDITLSPSSNLAAFNGIFNADYSPVLTKGNDLVFILSNLIATGGDTYQLIIENAEKADPYTVVSFGSNAAPTLSNVFGTCGGATISGLLVQCNNIAAGGQVTIAWTAADPDGPDTKVSVWYAQAPTATTTVTASAADLGNLYPIVENRPVGAGSVVWNLDGVPGGNYLIVVKVDDGRHPSTVEIAKKTLTTQALVVNVTDNKPPAVPTGLAALPQPKQVDVTWNQNTESDLAGYEIGFGTAPDVNQFLYTRDMGPKEDSTGVLGKTDAKLWGLQDNVTIYFGIRAYDLTGNYSDWSPLVATKPWDLSPNQFGPAPNSINKGTAVVEVVFLSPTGMNPATFASNIVLNGPNGPIPGTVEPILDIEGVQVIGFRFTPSGGVAAQAEVTAVIKGGGAGVKSLSGLQMNADFSWKFILQPNQTFVPLTVRSAASGW